MVDEVAHAPLVVGRGQAPLVVLDPADQVVERPDRVAVRREKVLVRGHCGAHGLLRIARTLRAGSLNQAIAGPSGPRAMPLASWSKPT